MIKVSNRSCLFCSIFITTALLIIFTGCTFYNLREHPTSELSKQTGKTIILHYKKIQVTLKKIQMTQTDLTGVVNKAISTDEEPDNSLHSDEQALEAHVYLDALQVDTIKFGMPLQIPLSSVTALKLYDVNVGKMIGTYCGIGAGATAAAIWIYLMATKQSCPFVYASNGETYGFVGEIFSGAVYPQLERHDYLALPPIKPVNGNYMIIITNEVKEIQHINFTELLAVDHPPNTRVLLDIDGTPHTLRDPRPAIGCVAADGRDASALTSSADSLSYTTKEERPDLVMDSLVFTFAREPSAQKAKLVLRVKNSFWLDYSYGRFLDLFGDKIQAWHASRKRIPAEQLVDWSRKQGLELGVFADNGKGWQPVRYCTQAGPMAFRDVVVPFTMAGPVENIVRIKLEFGARFWEIDQAAIDFSDNAPVSVAALPAQTALDENGKDLHAAVKSDDARYYDQPEIGNRATLAFDAPAVKAGYCRTVFLHSKGYYDILRFPSGKPNMASLQGFRRPGGFVRFSNGKMNELYHQDAGDAAQ